jgi:hypothetical protein
MSEDNKDKPASEAAAKDASAAVPQAPKKAAPKRAAATKAKPADEEVSRRGFLSWAAVAWVGFSAAIGGCTAAFGRFMFPNVLYEPPTSFKVGSPADFPVGVVDDRFKESNGVWIVNEEGKLFALIVPVMGVAIIRTESISRARHPVRWNARGYRSTPAMG